MRRVVGTLSRRAKLWLAPCMLAPCMLALSASSSFSGQPDAPITFDLSDSLQLKQPASSPAPLKLQDPGLPRGRRTGLDSFLQKMEPLNIELGGHRPVLTPSPVGPLPLGPATALAAVGVSGPVPTAPPAEPAKPDAMRLTTRMDRGARPIGEFPTRDWNRVADTDLRAPDALAPAQRLELSELGQLALGSATRGGSMPAPTGSGGMPISATAAPPAPPGAKTVEPENADTGPDAMARARAAVADARAQGLRGRARRPAGESLMVLPDFGTSGFQVGASFSLSGRPLGRIGFNDRSGPFDGQLGTRSRFGLEADDGEPLRLSDVDGVDRKPRKEDDGRLWTGVTFNF